MGIRINRELWQTLNKKTMRTKYIFTRSLQSLFFFTLALICLLSNPSELSLGIITKISAILLSCVGSYLVCKAVSLESYYDYLLDLKDRSRNRNELRERISDIEATIRHESKEIDIQEEIRHLMKLSEKLEISHIDKINPIAINKLSFENKVIRLSKKQHWNASFFTLENVHISKNLKTISGTIASENTFKINDKTFSGPRIGDVVHTAFGWGYITNKKSIDEYHILCIRSIEQDHFRIYLNGVSKIYCVIGGYTEDDYDKN